MQYLGKWGSGEVGRGGKWGSGDKIIDAGDFA
jgi:hypothetical protein